MGCQRLLPVDLRSSGRVRRNLLIDLLASCKTLASLLEKRRASRFWPSFAARAKLWQQVI